MCLITFHYHEHPKYPLIVVANRDELYERPTAQAHFWGDEPAILGGRDLSRQGTWLGITKTGRFAALTNYREPGEESINKKSRGDIIRNFLTADGTTAEFMEMLEKTKDQYAGFNLIAGCLGELFYFSNRQDGVYQIPAGTHGLSNHLLNTPWPKVVKGKTRLREYVLQQKELETDSLFEVLSDETPVPDEELPDTGVGLELERQLSSQFIKLPHYGTRSSTVLLIDSHQSITFVERTYVKGNQIDERKFQFQVMEKIC